MNWMIYGANGYTGKLIAEEAVNRGMTPVLAGRSNSVTELAGSLGLQSRVFSLDHNSSKQLEDMSLVLHCAGPFSATAEPMMQACLKSRTHYLDITGEIAVFELAQSLADPARDSGIVICPGVGFDVIPTDCVAATLKERMVDASQLALGFDSRSGLSRGTAKTSVEGLSTGGRIRKDGKLTQVPLAYRTRTIDFGDGEKLGMTIPWGDVATAYYTTGIPNIETYIAVSSQLPKRMRRLNLIRPILGLGIVQNLLKAQVEKRVTGPTPEQRRRNAMYVWGEVSNGRETLTGRLKTANGYDVTVNGSLGIVQNVLSTNRNGGAYTPSQLVGAAFAESLPGSEPIKLSHATA
ncbi:MAG: saccharopine dehydrogenase NADP-binding domain-containing protein [Gammaproteobacteria bacterium]|nr:saccharopine dehydrogenase NADP-binding domain-containing protein [Gammaproteobacteria bacterium]MDH3767351.1 saccharopine dehydrogenase NADP-binding domain-containing protein [Gammaproteobacteria bacterium]